MYIRLSYNCLHLCFSFLHLILTVICFQVTDYLLKRGFHRTEEIFRKESSNLGPDGRPQHKSTDLVGPKKYAKAFGMLKKFVESSLDYYKVSNSVNTVLIAVAD